MTRRFFPSVAFLCLELSGFVGITKGGSRIPARLLRDFELHAIMRQGLDECVCVMRGVALSFSAILSFESRGCFVVRFFARA